MIQRMQAANEEADAAPDKDCTTYASLLRACSVGSQYEKPNVVVFTTLFDDDHEKLFGNASATYSGHKCTILNSAEIAYDVDNGTLPTPTGNLLVSLRKACTAGRLILVFASHGNVQWLFGKTPGGEKAAIDKFARALKAWSEAVHETAAVSSWIPVIVLDACWSATEIAQGVSPNANNSCPARLLSVKYPRVSVFGINGKAAEDCVKYLKATDHRVVVKATYLENVVIFRDGRVSKPSRCAEASLHHSGEHMGNAFYKRLFATQEVPEFYLSTSFHQ